VSSLLKAPRGARRFINIENVVATAALHQNIDLNSIVCIFPGVEYRPEQFTGLVYHFGRLHKRYGKLPADFVALDDDGATDFGTMIDEMEKEGLAPNYTANFKKALVSWLDWNKIHLTRRLKIKDRGQNVKFLDEQIPLPDEVQRVLDQADPRQKVCISFVAYAGCREEVLGDIDGENGLRLRDLPEMKIENGKVSFIGIPTRVIVRANLNKARHQYETFLNEQACNYLIEYLEWRMSEKVVRIAKGGAKKIIRPETLSPESPAVTPERISIGKFLRSNQIGAIIKRAISAAGYGWRPYVFKSFFAENMTSAERKRTIIEEDRVWWMGHKGSIETVYTKNNDIKAARSMSMHSGGARWGSMHGSELQDLKPDFIFKSPFEALTLSDFRS
jgi:hypothetical protein